MAALYDRINPGFAGPAKLNVHVAVAVIKAVASGAITGAQALNAINFLLDEKNPGDELSAAEIADFVAIQAEITGTATQQLMYVVGRVEPAFIAADVGVLDDSGWRGILGIT